MASVNMPQSNGSAANRPTLFPPHAEARQDMGPESWHDTFLVLPGSTGRFLEQSSSAPRLKSLEALQEAGAVHLNMLLRMAAATSGMLGLTMT